MFRFPVLKLEKFLNFVFVASDNFLCVHKRLCQSCNGERFSNPEPGSQEITAISGSTVKTS